MKKTLIYMMLAAVLLAVSCKPDLYTGPLDSPVGNWRGVRSEYLFNGEQVADIDSCETTAISFYKQGLCCIEGVKGAFPYVYDNENGYLQIDNALWQVLTLTGAEVVMQYLYTVYTSEIPEVPEVPEAEPDANGVILPAEYKGFTITADANGYLYKNDEGKTVYCFFKGQKDESGDLVIDFWYDSHIDHFIPLVVTTPKK